jgi:hypothetical protein
MGVAAAGVYLTAKLCAASIVAYVVEETLVQKAPPGMDPQVIRFRLEKSLAGCADKNARLRRLLEIAQTLEKTQGLTPAQLESVLESSPAGSTELEP